MARYIGPKTKIARRFKDPIYGPDKNFEKKNYPPGQHGVSKKMKKTSEYGTQLNEKQKAKYTYGILEKQFRKHLKKMMSTFLMQKLPRKTEEKIFTIQNTRNLS